ncbi:MAG: hypothetical protein ICV56_03990 [Nitrososphaeraceae archaeon]|nr:hypothetical protein [Nitrososphaeraceae archaeon]
MPDEKTVLLLKYMGTELDLEPKILKKTLKGIGVKEIYVGKLEDNAIHLTCFAKWKTSQVDKKKAEIEKQIPKMKVVQIQPMTRI